MPRRQNSESTLAPEGSAPALQWATHVSKVTRTAREKMAELNKGLCGPVDDISTHDIPLPMVLVLGNHSSGKSSFINHALRCKVQDTGVAVTDDGFTIIKPSDIADDDRDGPSFLGDYREGFKPLLQFGENLERKVVLKQRMGLHLADLMLIDSPGMIDAKGDMSAMPGKERGYDFLAAVKWLAKQADVILFFFDPAKPGTTGETLDCLTKSLVGLEHKLHIVMNKVDSFHTIYDFARCYGSLCWNLSKVIKYKDMPPIHTMFIPDVDPKSGSATTSDTNNVFRQHLSETVTRVLNEVRAAPRRRADNLITRTCDEAELLKLYAAVLEEARTRLRRFNTSYRLVGAMLLVLAGVCAYAASLPPASYLGYAGLDNEAALMASLVEVAPKALMGACSAFTTVLLVVLPLWSRRRGAFVARMRRDGDLDDLFRTASAGSSEGDGVELTNERLVEQWRRVKAHLAAALPKLAGGKLPRVRKAQRKYIDSVLEEMQALRKKVAGARGDPSAEKSG